MKTVQKLFECTIIRMKNFEMKDGNNILVAKIFCIVLLTDSIYGFIFTGIAIDE